jgi:predicted Zn-dependent protease
VTTFSPLDAGVLAEIAHEALARAGLPEADLRLVHRRRGIARFGRSVLDQHLDLDEPEARVRVAQGGRVGVVSVSTHELAPLVEALHTADAIASYAPADPYFPGFLAGPGEPLLAVARYDLATAQMTAAERTEALEPCLRRIVQAGLFGAGALQTGEEAEAYVTTAGLRRAHRGTQASFRVWALESAASGGAAGFGHGLSSAFGGLDLAGETEHAVRLSLLGREPIALPAGAYDLVLEPAGLAEILDWLSLTSFGAREVTEGSSLVAGRRGQAVLGPSVTLRDDPGSALSLVGPFDFEGVARRRVDLVTNGVAQEVATDRRWAKRLGTETTGSSGVAEGFDAPLASALVMTGGGAADADELVRGVERGLYVARLHYVNGLLEPRRVVMTGMTRDGAFLIEKGQITRPVGNLRFTESIAEASFRMDGDGRTRGQRLLHSPTSAWVGGLSTIACPAVRFRQFTFSSGSQPVERLGLDDGR